ncbi:FecR family protein [Spirosoma sp. BT702]|uniref:FecR family protein n=1 Tax=Spirosoma profusum TaxID=2771354 RepID=A0A927AW10_9BACT|nr:FecR family protein [Spirosoma profusum]MBD2705465.1 FecR family protein [Spirosoma profusum]
MKQYKDYTVEDFLLDDDFLVWVRAGCPSTGTIWNELLAAYPEKEEAVNEAKAFIDDQRQGTHLPNLPDAELTYHIGNVLARTEVHGVPVRRLNSYATWWRIAAVVTLFIALGWTIFNWQSSQSTYGYEKLVKASTTSLTEIVNANRTSQSITLPDGSHVTLAKNARISYPAQMTKEAVRNVYLSGEAFFDVTKDPQHPFFVYTEGLVTRVVGTSFIIKTSGKQVSVIVRSGKVAVYSMNKAIKSGQVEKLMLAPNQQATFVPDENQLTRAIASQPVSLYTDNQKPTLQFEDTPITDVFAQLEKTYGIPIQYDTSQMKNCFLTSTLADEPFYTKLDIICRTIGASYKVEDTKIVVTSAGCE